MYLTCGSIEISFLAHKKHTPGYGLCIKKPAIQERGTECGERGECGECYISGNVAKHFGECRQTFRGMSQNIPGNVAKYSGECRQTFRGMSSFRGMSFRDIPQTFRGMSPNIPGNVTKHSRACHQKSRGTSPNIPGNVTNFWCKEQGCI